VINGYRKKTLALAPLPAKSRSGGPHNPLAVSLWQQGPCAWWDQQPSWGWWLDCCSSPKPALCQPAAASQLCGPSRRALSVAAHGACPSCPAPRSCENTVFGVVAGHLAHCWVLTRVKEPFQTCSYSWWHPLVRTRCCEWGRPSFVFALVSPSPHLTLLFTERNCAGMCVPLPLLVTRLGGRGGLWLSPEMGFSLGKISPSAL